MKRRELVAGGLSLLCVGVVGATRADELQPAASRPGRLGDDGSDRDASDADSRGAEDAAATADGATDATAGTDGSDDATPTAGGGDGGATPDGATDGDAESATIEVLSTTSGDTDVRLRLVRTRDGAVVHDHVRSFEYGERAYLSGHCERGETYAFTLAVDGAVLVRETVTPGERAMFELLDETTVSVVA